MKKSMSLLASMLVPVFIVALFGPAAVAATGNPEGARVESAVDVVNKIMAIPEKAIPPALLANAQGIAVIPGVIKVGAIVGGQYGRGVLSVRQADGSWSEPVFITLYSGSVGWQIGAESTDFVIVFKNRRSVDGIFDGKYTLGADAAVAAGPVGRRAEAATDVHMKAEIFSYSRNRGLFAGLSLDGSALQVDDAANAAFYGKAGIRPAEIVEGKAPEMPPVAVKFEKALDRHAPGSRRG